MRTLLDSSRACITCASHASLCSGLKEIREIEGGNSRGIDRDAPEETIHILNDWQRKGARNDKRGEAEESLIIIYSIAIEY